MDGCRWILWIMVHSTCCDGQGSLDFPATSPESYRPGRWAWWRDLGHQHRCSLPESQNCSWGFWLQEPPGATGGFLSKVDQEATGEWPHSCLQLSKQKLSKPSVFVTFRYIDFGSSCPKTCTCVHESGPNAQDSLSEVWMIMLDGMHYPVYHDLPYGLYSHVEPVVGIMSDHPLTDENFYDDDVVLHYTDVWYLAFLFFQLHLENEIPMRFYVRRFLFLTLDSRHQGRHPYLLPDDGKLAWHLSAVVPLSWTWLCGYHGGGSSYGKWCSLKENILYWKTLVTSLYLSHPWFQLNITCHMSKLYWTWVTLKPHDNQSLIGCEPLIGGRADQRLDKTFVYNAYTDIFIWFSSELVYCHPLLLSAALIWILDLQLFSCRFVGFQAIPASTSSVASAGQFKAFWMTKRVSPFPCL